MTVEAAALLAFVAGLGVWMLWSRRTVPAALVYTLLGITAAAGLVEMQGRAKPIVLEWRSVETAEVLWFGLREGESITLLLDIGEARLYVLPWNKEEAEELLKAEREAEGEDIGLNMWKPFERSLETGARMYYADPQPAPPLKPQ